jgi:hypothetical protein
MLIAAVIAGFLIAFPAPLISLSLFRLHLTQAFDQASSPLRHFQIDGSPAFLYYIRALGWGIGWPMLIMAAVGMVDGVAHRRSKSFMIACGVLCYYVGISLVQTRFARYALPLIPLLSLLAAMGVIAIVNAVQGRLSVRRPANGLPAVLLIGLVVAGPIVASVRFDYLLTQTDTRTQAKDWMEQNVPSGTRVLLQWFGPPLSRQSDPEPDSARMYDVVVLEPFMTGDEHYTLQNYIDDHVEYIIVNSFNTNLRLMNAQESELRRRFYESLEREAVLMAEFRSYQGEEEPPFVWEELYGPANSLFLFERTGPTIKIFRVNVPGL